MHYLLRINSLAPMAHGFAVEPQSYRVTGIMQTKDVSVDIPGADSAFVVLATKSDGNIVSSERVKINNGRLTYHAVIGPQIEHVLLVYPEMTSVDQQDFWEELDTERDTLLGSLRKRSLGAGLRGIVNPMGRGLSTPWREPRFVPTSPYFRLEFSKFLEEKYKNVETVLRSWSMASSSFSQLDEKKKALATFDHLSHLVPLWSTTRGIPAMLDPDTNQTFACDTKHSQAWDDITEVINTAGARRFSHLVPSIRSIADVPVIQEWLGWAAPYETRNPIIDGLGMRVSGIAQSSLADSGSRAVSSILRWATSGWLVTTDVDAGNSPEAAAQIPNILDDLSSMGAKGVFVRTDSPAILKAVSTESKTRSADTSAANRSPLPIFFPENAYNPAVPQKLPGDHWWLPTPSDGNRIDLGSKFFAYRSSLSDGTFALWARTPGRYKLDMRNPKMAHFRTLDGSDPLPKYFKDGVELAISEVPLIISGTLEVPIPDVALLETVQRFEALINAAKSNKRGSGEEEMYFNDSVNGFDRNPGGSFEQMRKMYWKLSAKLAPYTWIEAEKYADTNFSEVMVIPGCSGGSALALHTLIQPGPEGYFAEYNVPVKTRQDQDVWISAKVPVERRGEVSVNVGGQQLRLTGDPLSIYNGGFGWYKLGTTRMAGNVTKVRVHVDSAASGEIGVDVILLTPVGFTPNGITPPDAINFSDLPAKGQKKAKRKGFGGS
jgi:hypothetical protein